MAKKKKGSKKKEAKESTKYFVPSLNKWITREELDKLNQEKDNK